MRLDLANSRDVLAVRRRLVLFGIALALAACSTPTYEGLQPTMQTRRPHTHMEETVRAPIETVVVMPHTVQAETMVFGTYNAPQMGAALNAAWSSRSTMDMAAGIITGGLPAEIVIPILVLPSVLYGGIKGYIKEEIQEFRDQLTDELKQAAGELSVNEKLANDVYSKLRLVPGIDTNVIADTTPLPEATDVVLLVRWLGILIEVQEEDATIEASASATLRRVSDGKTLYANTYFYKDRDTLRHWTRNDGALWRDFINFARHYMAREITAELFEKYELRHDLYPIPTDSVVIQDDDNWTTVSQSSMPEVAWKLVLLGRDSYGPWSSAINENDTYYDLEIYDQHRMVYSARQLPGSYHELRQPLGDCKELRWTVRPSYHVGGKVRYGEWMRFHSSVNLDEGHVGSKASEIPAFTRGFALLKTKCG